MSGPLDVSVELNLPSFYLRLRNSSTDSFSSPSVISDYGPDQRLGCRLSGLHVTSRMWVLQGKSIIIIILV